eukprot:403374566
MKVITSYTLLLNLLAIATFAQDDCVPTPYCGERIDESVQCKVNCDCLYPDEYCNVDGYCDKDESLYDQNGYPILLPMTDQIYCDLVSRPRAKCLTACDCIYQDTECREDGECYIMRAYYPDPCNP